AVQPDVEIEEQVVAVGPAEAVLVAHPIVTEEFEDVVVLQGNDDVHAGAGHRGRTRGGPGRQDEPGDENQRGHGGRTAPAVHQPASSTLNPTAVRGAPALAGTRGAGRPGLPGRPASTPGCVLTQPPRPGR